MPFEQEFLTMMPRSIGIKPMTSRDAWGNRSYGTISYYQGRIQNKRRKVINRDGDEVISETTLYLATTVNIGIDDQITMPSGFLPLHPEIIAVRPLDDDWGSHHLTLYV